METNLPELRTQLSKTQGFIFDMDGTVVDLEELNFTSFESTIKEKLRITLTNDDYQTYISGRGSLNGLQSYLESIGEDTRLAEELQKEYRTLKREALAHMFDEVVHVEHGVRTLLALLKEKRKKTCLATSTGREFCDTILTGTKLEFDIVLTREDIKKIKPDPSIFNLALARLGTKEGDTIAFEDSINGIEAAQSAGIFCVGIHNVGLNDKFIENADAVIENFHPVSHILNAY